jgi:hypothetical protein
VLVGLASCWSKITYNIAVYHAVKCIDELQMYFLYLEGMSGNVQMLENQIHRKMFVPKGIKEVASGGHSTFNLCSLAVIRIV